MTSIIAGYDHCTIHYCNRRTGCIALLGNGYVSFYQREGKPVPVRPMDARMQPNVTTTTNTATFLRKEQHMATSAIMNADHRCMRFRKCCHVSLQCYCTDQCSLVGVVFSKLYLDSKKEVASEVEHATPSPLSEIGSYKCLDASDGPSQNQACSPVVSKTSTHLRSNKRRDLL